MFNPLRQHQFQRLIRHRSARFSRTQHGTGKLNVEKTLNFVPRMFPGCLCWPAQVRNVDSHKKSEPKKSPVRKTGERINDNGRDTLAPPGRQ